MFREIMAIKTSQMMTSRSLICLLENQNGGKLQKKLFLTRMREKMTRYGTFFKTSGPIKKSHIL
jgi:hypothetical protein